MVDEVDQTKKYFRINTFITRKFLNAGTRPLNEAITKQKLKNLNLLTLKKTCILFISMAMLLSGCSHKVRINYVDQFENTNHPEIGYWFISPNLIADQNKIVNNVDSILDKCMYTTLFLTARAGANFYDFEQLHPVFQKIVTRAHERGLKVGLQLWGNYNDSTIEGSQRMIVENEVRLDQSGNASQTIKAKYVRFPKRLLQSELFKVYAFRKTSEGFYDPSSLQDISAQCQSTTPDKETVKVHIKGGMRNAGLTACIITQEYCSQSSMWGNVEINSFVEAMQAYSDIPFDGFALDEFGNKFVSRDAELKGEAFRGRWYSNEMAEAYQKETGESLEKTMFDARYAPEGKPEIRIKAINQYMDFMRKGALRVENEVMKHAKEIFGPDIFIGIHNTYHNSNITTDEIWANGLGWWDAPREYGQTDERTPTPIQMGVAMAHQKNAMYNQFYDGVLEPVLVKAFSDLRWGIRTHYHALNDKRPNRFDLEFPEAIIGINRIEKCARLMNRFNPSLPDVRLLVIFGIEALSNWYPNEADRGVYDINDKIGIFEKGNEIWDSGYLNAIVPSDLIVNGKLILNANGKPELNGHVFDAILYLNPQYAREPVLKFLEEYEAKGGKLMIEGSADRNFKGNDISDQFSSIFENATVNGYSVNNLAKLGLEKNVLPDGCKNEDGSYIFIDENSLRTPAIASFSVDIDGVRYSGKYKGVALIDADKTSGLKKFTAAGFTELNRDGKVILSFKNPVDIYLEKQNNKYELTLADQTKSIEPIKKNL
jgi:hypothetical protein